MQELQRKKDSSLASCRLQAEVQLLKHRKVREQRIAVLKGECRCCTVLQEADTAAEHQSDRQVAPLRRSRTGSGSRTVVHTTRGQSTESKVRKIPEL